jgi:hypothetical protein
MAHAQILSKHFPGGTGKNREKSIRIFGVVAETGNEHLSEVWLLGLRDVHDLTLENHAQDCDSDYHRKHLRYMVENCSAFLTPCAIPVSTSYCYRMMQPNSDVSTKNYVLKTNEK